MAAMETTKADEGLFELIKGHEREKEDLQEKITQLENLLEEKEGELEGLQEWGKILTLKERKSSWELHQLRLEIRNRPKQEIDMRLISDELNEARKELINGWKDIPKRGNIGIKRMGELYFNPFLRVMKSNYNATDAEIKASEAWSLWKEYIRDPEWYPFKVVTDNGKDQLVIDVQDEKLKALREELGDEVYETVIRAVKELNENNSDKMSLELWNFSEEKKATLKEGILAILANQMGVLEELQSARSLAISLAKQIDMKNEMLCELEYKCDDLIKDKDRLRQSLCEEMKMMEIKSLPNINLEREVEIQSRKAESSSCENEKLKHELEYQMQIFEEPTKEFYNKCCDIKQEPTSLQTKDETLEPMNCDDGDHSLTTQIKELKKELSEKIEDLQYLEAVNQALLSKERICNDELQDARKEAMRVLRGMLNQRTTLRIKRMGEVDLKPFQKICSEKVLNGENVNEVSAKLCSKWQNEVENPKWQPFIKVQIDGKLKEIINENDEKLKNLRNEHGDEAFKAVVNALMEMNEYNPSGRYIQAEIWFHKESRIATLKEVIQYMFRQWHNNKLKRKRS